MPGNPTVVFVQPRRVEIQDRDIPTPAAGQLLIRTRRTLISTGTELTILTGEFPADSVWARYGKFPFVPGYDNIGDVVEVGPETDASWIGKRVGTYGAHAAYVTAAATTARLVQRDIPDDHAVFFTLAEIVMNGIRRGRVAWGEAVVVYGAGLLGQLTARFCRLAGARPVVVVDVADARLQRLPQDVALLAVNPRTRNAVDVVREATRGRMADVVFEVTGDPDLIPDEFAVLHKMGRLVVLSSPRGKTAFDFHDLCNSPSYTIIGAHNSSHPLVATFDNPWTNQRDAEFFFDLVADGEVDLSPLISHRERYGEAVRLYDMLVQDRTPAMGVLLEW